MYFTQKEYNIEYDSDVKLFKSYNEWQFSNYKLLNFKEINQFIEKYFNLSEKVNLIISKMEEKYNIDYKNTIAVFYRGNDKIIETNIGSYDTFLNKILLEYYSNQNRKILIQTDDQNFLDYCEERINNKIIVFDEIPCVKNNHNIVIHKTIEPDKRTEFAAYFLAITKILSKSNILITHSGNCGMWAVLFRGNANNIHQYLDDKYKSKSDGWL